MADRPAASNTEPERDIPRADSMPAERVIPPFDAGWHAHRLGLERKTVEVLAFDREWALMGWDCRAALAARGRLA